MLTNFLADALYGLKNLSYGAAALLNQLNEKLPKRLSPKDLSNNLRNTEYN